MKNMWMVRAERGGVLFDRFKDEGFVAMGLQIGSLQSLHSRKDIAKLIKSHLPNWSSGKVNIWAGMLHRFQNEISVGDGVITYDPSRRHYLIGKIDSECIYKPELVEGDPFVREVTWKGEVSRDSLSLSTKNTLGAISTLFLLSNSAAEEITSLLEGKPISESADKELVDEDEAELLANVKEQSKEYIKDKISKLDGYQLQNLVAGVLNAMGYKTQVSKGGSDRGVDILASPDGFGFEQPRIVVECKHRKGAMGSQEIRSFLGGRHKDDKGLYVSTGGFTKDAKYEAERASIPVTLMDMDQLVDAIVEHYENMDSEIRTMLPLIKIYWPV